MIAYFDEAYYLRGNADVASAVYRGVFASGLEHYQRYGSYELRNPSAVFFADYYVETNPDVRAAVAQRGMTPLEHFELAGLKENRSPTSATGGFDGNRYLADNPDVRAAVAQGSFVSALDHYLQFGAAEGRPYHVTAASRATHPYFDEAYYLSHNPDVAAAVSTGAFTSGLQHFQVIGAQEMRDPSAAFNTEFYRGASAGYSLIAFARGTIVSYFDHFERYGLELNLPPLQRFAGLNAERYLAENPDVQAAVTAGAFASALDHYMRFGMDESRPAYGTLGNTFVGPDDTFLLAASATSADEGSTFLVTLTTTNVAPGAQYRYSLNSGFNFGSRQPEIDTVTPNAGVVTVGADGKATLSVTVLADERTEGPETLRIFIAGQEIQVTLNDTSLTPGTILTSPLSSAAEGSTVVLTLRTTEYLPGTTLPYTISGISAEDLHAGDSLTGFVTIGSDGSATLPIRLAADGAAEAMETMRVDLGGRNVSVSVVDSATATPQTYFLTNGVDSFVGAAGNDAFYGSYSSGSESQLAGADMLAGNSGTDTVVLSVNDVAVAIADAAWANVSGMEKIVIGAPPGFALTAGENFQRAFQSGLDLTATVSSGATAIDLGGQASGTTYAPGATIVVTSGGDQTITTGSGADHVSAYAPTSTRTMRTISTGAGDDVIVVHADNTSTESVQGSAVLTGGAGADSFGFGRNGASITNIVGSSVVAITDFNFGGSDSLNFDQAPFSGPTVVQPADVSAPLAGANVQTSAGGLIAFHASDNTLALKIAAVQADAELDAAGSVAMFVEGGSTYLYYAGTAAGNLDDQLVQLTGIATLTTITGGASTTIA